MYKYRKAIITAIAVILLLAGCATVGIDNGTAGNNVAIQGSASVTQTTAGQTSDTIPAVTTQPDAVRMEITGPEWSVPLTVEMQDAINEAICARSGSESALTWDDDTYWVIRYYGTYDGHVVYFIDSPLTMLTEIVLGDQTIIHGTVCELWVYSDGELCTLRRPTTMAC